MRAGDARRAPMRSTPTAAKPCSPNSSSAASRIAWERSAGAGRRRSVCCAGPGHTGTVTTVTSVRRGGGGGMGEARRRHDGDRDRAARAASGGLSARRSARGASASRWPTWTATPPRRPRRRCGRPARRRSGWRSTSPTARRSRGRRGRAGAARRRRHPRQQRRVGRAAAVRGDRRGVLASASWRSTTYGALRVTRELLPGDARARLGRVVSTGSDAGARRLVAGVRLRGRQGPA